MGERKYRLTEEAIEAWLRRKYVVRTNRGIDYLEAAVDALAREISNFLQGDYQVCQSLTFAYEIREALGLNKYCSLDGLADRARELRVAADEATNRRA